MPKPTKLYSTDPAWADITPLPLPDTPSPLASIAYTDEYAEATAYLRAVMAADEHSPRVLDLTAHVISLNPGHYTVWLYRFATISKLGVSLKEELQWLRDVSLRNLKNYQIWHHRMGVVDLVGQEGELDMQAEREFLAEMLERDAKNYHVWSYRQWMVKRFGLFEDADEMEWTGEMIEADVRNNSAWNHRYYLCFGGREGDVPKEVVEREIAYAKSAIHKAPQNQSPWNYLRGVLRKSKLPISSIKDFAQGFADLEKPDDVSSTHALDVLVDVYAEENRKADAVKALELLSERYDPIRAKYWDYRRTALEAGEVEA